MRLEKIIQQVFSPGFCLFAGILLSIILSPFANSAEKPLWEIGAGLGAISLPHYLGSKESSGIVLPIPYLIYRGETIRSKNGEMQGVLFSNKRLKVDISISGSIPFDSDDNKAREDMPTLDPLFEFGPRLIFDLPRSASSPHHWKLRLPIRSANSIDDFSFEHQGWITNPTILYIYLGKEDRWKFTAGPILANDRYHAYLYDVAPEFATQKRPAYRAKAGLTAMRFTVGYTKFFRDWQIKLRSTYMPLNEAKNENSPLMTSNHYLSVSIALVRILGKSEIMVEAE